MSEIEDGKLDITEEASNWMYKRVFSIARNKSNFKNMQKFLTELGFEIIGSNLQIGMVRGRDNKIFQANGDFIFTHKTEKVLIKVNLSSMFTHELSVSYLTMLTENEELRKKYTTLLLTLCKKYVRPRRFNPPPSKTYAALLVQTEAGHQLVDFEVGARYADDSYYNEASGFKISELETLINKTKYGLVYLSGVPGSGKTSLIYDLTKRCNGRRFVFIPHSQLGIFQKPNNLMELFNTLQDSVLIIEDAEGLFKKRDENTIGGITSFLLNATDGFLAEALGCLTIVTQNMTENIDEAFLRKGRLIKHCNFKKLPYEQAVTVAEKLERVAPTEKTEYSLAEVYSFPMKEGAVKKEELESTSGRKNITADDEAEENSAIETALISAIEELERR